MFESLGKLVLYLLGDSTSYTKMLKQATADFQGATSAIRSTGTLLTSTVTGPLLSIGVASTSAAMDFQRSMAQIVGLVGVARSQVAAWSKDLLNIAPQFAKDPQELARGLYYITSAGFRGKEALDALEVASMAAAAGLGEVKDITFAVTSAMNAYRKSGLTAIQVTDMITAAAREGHFEADQLAKVLGQILPLGSAMKVPLNDILAATAALTRVGASPAQAIIGIQGIFKNFLKPTVAAQKALAGVGLDFAQLRDMIKQPGGLLQVLILLHNAMDKEGDLGGGLAGVFGEIRPLRAALGLLAQDSSEVQDIFDKLSHSAGSTKDAFDAVSSTSGFKFDQMMTQLKVTLITVGDVIAEVITPALDTINSTLKVAKDYWDGLDPSVKKFIVYIGIAAAAIGPLLLAIGALGTIGPIIAGMVATFSGLATFILPLIPLIIILGVQIKMMIDKAGGLEAIWAKAQKAFNDFYNNAKPIIDALASFFTEAWKQISGLAQWVFDKWWGNMQAAFTLFMMGWDKFQNFILGVLKKISGDNQLTWEKVRDNIVTAIYFAEYTIGHFQQVMDVVGAAVYYQWVKIGNVITYYMKYGVELAIWFSNTWVSVWKTIYDTGNAVFSKLFDNLSQVDLAKLLTGEQSIKDIFKGSWEEIQKGVTAISDHAPKLAERQATVEEKMALMYLKSKSNQLFQDFSAFLAAKKGIPGAAEEEKKAEKQGTATAAAYKNALKREFNTIDAALTFSAEGFKRIREYFAMLTGEGIGKGPGNALHFNPKGPKALDKKPIIQFDARDRRVADYKTTDDDSNALLAKILDVLIQNGKDRQNNSVDVLPLDIGTV